MSSRREFIYHSILVGLGLSFLPQNLVASAKDAHALTLLHTGFNSGLESSEDADLLQHLRKRHPDALLLSTGNVFVNHAVYGHYHGISEILHMNECGYRVFCPGINELLNGEDKLEAILRHSKFSSVCCNISFSHRKLAQTVKPFTTLDKNGIRIGITAVVDPAQFDDNYPNFKYLKISDPVIAATKALMHLKADLKCDKLILLSQLAPDCEGFHALLNHNTITRLADCILTGRNTGSENSLTVRKSSSGKNCTVSISAPGKPGICRI